MQITNRNTHTAWAAKVDELLELYLAIRGDELLKRRDFVPQLLAPLTWCLHKVYNNQKKEKNIQNTERSGDVDVRNQAGIEASLLCIQTGFTCEQNNLGYLHHRLISCWFRIAPLAVLWTLCCRWRRCLEPL